MPVALLSDLGLSVNLGLPKKGHKMKKDEAVALFGSAAKMARALGVTRQSINKWGDDVPPLRVYQIKELLAKKDKT